MGADGTMHTKLLQGPASLEEWLVCWGVYEAACVMLQIASPGNLEEYKSGIVLLAGRFPQAWGQIWAWDECMRSCHWGRLREEIAMKTVIPRSGL